MDVSSKSIHLWTQLIEKIVDQLHLVCYHFALVGGLLLRGQWAFVSSLHWLYCFFFFFPFTIIYYVYGDLYILVLEEGIILGYYLIEKLNMYVFGTIILYYLVGNLFNAQESNIIYSVFFFFGLSLISYSIVSY